MISWSLAGTEPWVSVLEVAIQTVNLFLGHSSWSEVEDICATMGNARTAVTGPFACRDYFSLSRYEPSSCY